MTEKTFVVNVCNQRTGSKYLGSCLRSGADIVPLGEIFNPDRGQAFTFWSWLADNSREEYRGGISVDLLDRFFDSIYTQLGPVYFDLMYNQIPAICPLWQDRFGIFILDYFIKRNFHVVHTERDPADIYLSLVNLSVRGVPHVVPGVGGGESELREVTISIDDYLGFENNYCRWKSAVDSTFDGYSRFFNLSFSHLVSNNGFLPDDVMRFMSDAVAHSGRAYGNHIQVRESIFGKSPESVVRVLNLEEFFRFARKSV